MKRTALCLALLAACSKSETAAPSSAAPAAAPAAPAPAAPAQKPDDPAKALEQLGNALAQKPGGKPGEAVKAVNWRELTPLLSDEVAGWKATAPARGETAAMGAFQVSNAERSYKSGDVTARVKIVDTSMNNMLTAGWRMARTVTADSSDHYQRAVDVAGQPGIEEWHSSKSGKVTVLVADRFILEIDASGVPDTKGLVALGGKLDLAKLASLAK